jgi:hypothetical protein
MYETMRPERLTSALYIVQIVGFFGDETHSVLQGPNGTRLKAVYCIAKQNQTSGVLELIDYGNQSVAEARAAWPGAL